MFTLLKTTAIEVYRRDQLLTLLALGLLAGVAAMAVIAPFDERLVAGLNPWIKPAKFAVSFAAYFLTLAWLLAYLPEPRKAIRMISRLSAAGILFEMPVLVGQAARGVSSHFNQTTRFDHALSILMGAGAFLQMGMLAWALVLFCTRKVELPRTYLWGIRAGMGLVLCGVAPAIAMLILKQHNVGVEDGGPGLPLFNFSTLGGDLRITHFLGLHAIQLLPLAGYLLSRPAASHPAHMNHRPHGTALFGLLASVYGLVMLLTLAQALGGQPLVRWEDIATTSAALR